MDEPALLATADLFSILRQQSEVDPNAWAYLDLYGIPTNSSLVSQHPDWILHDSKGNRLYIPFACSSGSCVEYAGDAGNPSFVNWWINNATSIMGHGYKGLWLDNVNLPWRVSDGNGNFVTRLTPEQDQQ